MHELLSHHEDPRRFMSLEAAMTVETVPFAIPGQMDNLADQMSDPSRLDGWQTTQTLTKGLGPAYDLYWSDLGLLRVCLGNEHATAVFDGNEIDYIPLFADNPDVLKISRLTALLQDCGKALSIVRTGSNFAQSKYNVETAEKIISSVSDEKLSPAVKQAVIALVGLDVVGGMLQGHDVDEKLAQFQADWPDEFLEFRDDLMLSSYLSDASAHSSYRLYRNARNGFVEPAVKPDDAQLTFLFARHRSGAVTLTPDRCGLLLSRLPGISRLRYLLTDELGPYAREDEAFAEVVTRQARTGDEHGLRIEDQQEYQRDFIIMEGAGSLGVSASIITYPCARYDIATDRRYWLPGDGRLWERVVSVGNTSAEEYGPVPENYAHPDPDVAKMQKRVLCADISQNSAIGRPLAPEEAWDVIHRLENLAEIKMPAGKVYRWQPH